MVTRCVCFDVPFSAMKKIAGEHGIHDMESLRAHVQFGEKCQLCVPYVEAMLKTGTTEFEAAFDPLASNE